MLFRKKISETERLFMDMLYKIEGSDPEFFKEFNKQFTSIAEESVAIWKIWEKATKVSDIMQKFMLLESLLDVRLINTTSEFKTKLTKTSHNDFLGFVSQYSNRTDIWRSIYFNAILMKIEYS